MPSNSTPEGFRQADGTAPMRRDFMASKALKPLPGQLLLFATCPRCQAHLMVVGHQRKTLQTICTQCGSPPEAGTSGEP
jgi:hypothetical protein